MLCSRAFLDRFIDIADHGDRALVDLMADLGLEVKTMEHVEGDTILNIELLANRGDHACHHGIARELSARLLRPVRLPAVAELPAGPSAVPVRIDSPLCLRYTLLDVPALPQGELPADTRAVLQRLQVGQHGFAADVTNLVNVELGQPMHAFDRERIDGEIIVRCLDAPERVAALDGKSYDVPAGALVICDRSKVVAIAGVIGCANSQVTASTRGVLLESALFDPVSVRLTARAMKISTAASFRFERGADSAMAELGQRRALALLGGGAAGWADVWPGRVMAPRVALRLPELQRSLAMHIPDDVVRARLAHLGFDVAPESDDVWSVGVPSHRRWDVEAEQDLVEEVAKAHGYNATPQELPLITPGDPTLTDRDVLDARLLQVMVSLGFHEVIAPALHGPDLVARLPLPEGHPLRVHVTTINSLVGDFSTLRNSCLPVLCRIVRDNLARGVRGVKVFERGVTFHPDPASDTGVRERMVLAAAASGPWSPESWREQKAVDFFHLKGAVELLARTFGAEVSFADSDRPLLQPMSRASVLLGGNVVGAVGRVHPEALEDARDAVFYFELELAPFVPFVRNVPLCTEPSDYPAAWRDITWILPDGGARAGDVSATMRHAAGELCVGVAVAGLFRAPGEPAARVTWRMTFQSAERTLRKEELDAVMSEVAAAVESSHGVKRG